MSRWHSCPRHGSDHQFPAHRVPFRANAWAMKELGVDRVIGPCAVGSLQMPIAPGHLLVSDQQVDRTWGRDHTFFDGPETRHLGLRRSVLLRAPTARRRRLPGRRR